MKINIIVMIVIILMLFSCKRIDKEYIKMEQTKQTIISQAIQEYYINYNKLPDNIDSLIEEDFLSEEKMLYDVWGMKYIYLKGGDRSFKIISYGRDKKTGGDGVNQDIVLECNF
jgi:hypothetical protein